MRRRNIPAKRHFEGEASVHTQVKVFDNASNKEVLFSVVDWLIDETANRAICRSLFLPQIYYGIDYYQCHNTWVRDITNNN